MKRSNVYQPVDLNIFLETLDTNTLVYLSTGSDGRVVSRPANALHEGMIIYFKVHKSAAIVKQIEITPTISLVLGNYHMDGSVRSRGACSLALNKELLTKYREKYPAAFLDDADMHKNIFLEIAPTRLRHWLFESDAPVVLAESYFEPGRKLAYDLPT